MTAKILTCLVVAVLFLIFGQNCSNVKFAEGKVEESLVEDNGKTYRKIDQTVQVKANADVDILFVVDNSGSMAQEQVGFGDKVKGFMQLIDGLNWRVALTTTDPTANTKDAAGTLRAWGDGQFRPFDSDTGTKFVLKAGEQPLASAQDMLTQAIQVGIKGGGNESGIRVAYRALERATDDSFFRPSASLAVVLISDEDECSNGSCLSTVAASNPESLVDLIKNRFPASKKFSYHSIIRKANDSTCTSGTIGATYTKISQLTAGLVGSVCAADYTAILTGIGTRIIESVKSANLVCEPVDQNGDGLPDVSITLSTGQVIDHSSNINGTLLTFPSSLPEGSHTLSYFCEPDAK
jgi:hypothetical protein